MRRLQHISHQPMEGAESLLTGLTRGETNSLRHHTQARRIHKHSVAAAFVDNFYVASHYLDAAFFARTARLSEVCSEYAGCLDRSLRSRLSGHRRCQIPPMCWPMPATTWSSEPNACPNYTCVQTVDREYFVRSTPTPPYASCDQMSAAARKKPYSLKVDATDRLRLDVKVSGGEEIGSWAGTCVPHCDSARSSGRRRRLIATLCQTRSHG
jgi:hypothetical protein